MVPIIRTCSFALIAFALATPAGAASGLDAYVRARLADADGATTAAVDDYTAALSDAPADARPIVAEHAYREAVSAGDFALADRAAGALSGTEAYPADAVLLDVAKAFAVGAPSAMDASVASLRTSKLAILAPSVAGWAALATGRDPFAPLADPGDGVVAKRLARETRALLRVARGEADGIAEVAAAAGNDRAGADLRDTATALLAARTGDKGRTRAGGLMTDPPARDGVAAFGVSHLFSRLALDLMEDRTSPLATTLVQAALRADPANDRAQLLIAVVLANVGQSDRALAAIDAVAAKGALSDEARTLRIALLSDAGRNDAAIDDARRLADESRASSADIQRLGNLYLAADRPGEAATTFRRNLDNRTPQWSDWLLYGTALDAAGKWSEAERALQKAVALGPDQPLALNQLGYSRLERGQDIAASLKLLERAHALRPDDAAIADSLGYAYLLSGDAARAVMLLEGALAKLPTNPEVSEHLGDAYWTLGRRYEARYAWRAALVTAEPGEEARLTAKIANGFPPR